MSADDIINPPGPNPQDPGMTNAQVLRLGATALITIRTGHPSRKFYDPDQLVYAENWLEYWALAAEWARTKEEFIQVMTFLMYP